MRRASIILLGLVLALGAAMAFLWRDGSDHRAVPETIAPPATPVAGGHEAPTLVKSAEPPFPEDPRVVAGKAAAVALLPRLYASDDIDALITGAAFLDLPQNAEGDYTIEDFFKLGLSLEPDDPTLLAFIASWCTGQIQRVRDRQQAGLPPSLVRKLGPPKPHDFCEGTTYLERMSDITPHNAWASALLARASEDPQRRAHYLDEVAKAQDFNNYDVETRRVLLRTSRRYTSTEEEADDVFLYGLSTFGFGASDRTGFLSSLCNSRTVSAHPTYLPGCSKIGHYLLHDSTLMGISNGIAIVWQMEDVSGIPKANRPEISNSIELVKWMSVVRPDSGSHTYFENDLLHFTEVDAIKDTLVHFGEVEDDGKLLVRIDDE